MIEVFEYTRNAVISYVNTLDEGAADKKAPYFNNTIRWHIGHILVAAESLLFGFPKHSTNIPEHYEKLFGTGTKPSDWKDEPPSLKELVDQLEAQKNRIMALDDSFFEKNLPFTLPFGNFKTFGELFQMIIQHESEHLGKAKAMHQVITKS